MLSVDLKYSQSAATLALLRPLTGLDEQAIRGRGLVAAVSLVARLLVRSGSTLDPEALTSLAVADFDRIVLRLQQWLYGDALECQSACRACQTRFEFTLPLASLAVGGNGSSAVSRVPQRPGWFRAQSGVVFRLPTLGDLFAGLTQERLRVICTEGEVGFSSTEEADAVFAAAGPLANEMIETACPQCKAAQVVVLDLVDYLMDTLARERPFVVHETHRIACAYGWSLRDIQTLERDDRRAFVRLIAEEAAVRTRLQRRAG